MTAMSRHPSPPARRRAEVRRIIRLEVELLEERCVLSGGPFWAQPIVPVIDATMQAHLQAVLLHGFQLGNRPDVFAKIGDSITASPSYLVALGSPAYDPSNPLLTGGFTDLASAINFFRAQPIDATGANSFNHVSLAGLPGWTAADLLDPGHYLALTGESPLVTELQLDHPAFALIMIGTNDGTLGTNPEVFRAELTAITSTALANGVIPVLSTIPDNHLAGGVFEGRVYVINQVITDVADDLNVPLWNYWAALQLLPNQGLSSDQIHPSTYAPGSGFFTGDALLNGYNMRNLTAVSVLAKLENVVLEDAIPDGFVAEVLPPPAPAAVTHTVTPAPASVAAPVGGPVTGIVADSFDPEALPDVLPDVPTLSVPIPDWLIGENQTSPVGDGAADAAVSRVDNPAPVQTLESAADVEAATGDNPLFP
jgi:lysophospholipase L1-like esterase